MPAQAQPFFAGVGANPLPPGVRVQRTDPTLFLAVCRRLVSQQNPDIDQAARRLLENSAAHNIDLTNTWASLDEVPSMAPSAPPSPPTPRVRQACLLSTSPGRTAMLFLSEPPRYGDLGGPSAGMIERAALLREACAWLAQHPHVRVVLAQALPDADELWACDAFRTAGFRSVGTLLYLRRPPRSHDARLSLGPNLDRAIWPQGVRVLSLASIEPARRDATLIAAMDASYEQTLDCPELCGLRATSDILVSHKSTGLFDPSLWWIVLRDDQPMGCMLLSMCPEQRSIELVYVGLSPALRGLGLGVRLLNHGVGVCAGLEPSWPITCAVDERNVPALRLYEAMHFRSFARRRAFVLPIAPAHAS